MGSRRTPENKRSPASRAILLLAAVSALALLGRLGTPPLTSANEGLYGQVAREMLETGDWLVPQVNTVTYLEKPPLLYWLVAISMRLGGENAAAARLPSAVGGLVTIGTVLGLGSVIFGPRVGVLAGFVMATCIGFLLVTRQVMFDGLLTACLTVSLAAFYGAWRLQRWFLSYMGYLGLAAATMIKGLVAPVLVILVWGVWAVVGRDWRRLRPLAVPGPLLVYLALVVPWHVAASLRRPDFVWFYFYNEHLGRFLGTRQPRDWSGGAVYTPLAGLLLLTLPWGFWLPAALYDAWRRRAVPSTRLDQDFLLSWLLVPLAFFTLAKNRQYAYMMPAAPAVALLVAGLWGRLLSQGRAIPGTSADPRGQACTGEVSTEPLGGWVKLPAVALLVLLAAGWAVAGARAGAGGTSGARAAMAFASFWALVAGLSVGLVLSRWRGLSALLECTCAGAAVTWLLAIAWVRADAFDTSEPLARALLASSPPPSAAVAVEGRLENYSSFLFYLPRHLRPVYVVEGRMGGDLQYGSTDPAVRYLFLSAEEFADLWACRPVFYLCPERPRFGPPPGACKIGSSGKKVLWSNRGERAPIAQAGGRGGSHGLVAQASLAAADRFDPGG